MDTRFPPSPGKILVPLYPQKGRIIVRAKRASKPALIHKMCSSLGATPEQLLFAASASNALFFYLQYVNKHAAGKLRVALPAFSCLSLAQSIIAAGCKPVFIDVDSNLSVTLEGARFAHKNNCQVLIWPSYFGVRLKDEAVLRYLQRKNIKIVFDEAQSYPLAAHRAIGQAGQFADVVLFSFGQSKPLASEGGGCLYKINVDSTWQDMKAASTDSTSYRPKLSVGHFTAPVLQRFWWSWPPVRSIFKQSPNYPELDTLLEDSHLHEVSDKYEPMRCRQAQVILSNWTKFTEAYAQHRQDYKRLLSTLRRYDTSADRYLRSVVDVPSILAIKVRPEHRYTMLAALSHHGVQATWYYFPLNMLSEYRRFPVQQLRHTPTVAATVLILPFQWLHSSKQKHILQAAVTSMYHDN